MLGNIRGLSNWRCKDYVERSTHFENDELWNKMNKMVTQNLQWQLDLEANWQVIER
jgi:hypothetical protein